MIEMVFVFCAANLARCCVLSELKGYMLSERQYLSKQIYPITMSSSTLASPEYTLS